MMPLAVINAFLCPSDSNAQKGINWNSYSASQGTTAQGNPGQATGMFACTFAYGLRDALDGSSNTVALSEKLVGNPQKYSWRGNGINGSGPVGTADAWQAQAQVMTDLQTCNTSWNSAIASGNSGGVIKTNVGLYWIAGTEAFSMFMTIVPPSSTQYPWGECRSGCPTCSPDSNQYSNASSNHFGGANTLMSDGSVRFIKSSIAMNVWWGLGTRANSEVIDASSY